MVKFLLNALGCNLVGIYDEEFERRAELVKALLRTFARTRYGRARGFAEEPLSYSDFMEIPLMDSYTLVSSPESLTVDANECIAFRSSGTTGLRKTVYVPRDVRTAPLPDEIAKNVSASRKPVFAHSKRDREELFYWVHDTTYRELYRHAAIVEYYDLKSISKAISGDLLCIYDYPSAVKFFLHSARILAEKHGRSSIRKKAVYIELTGEPVSAHEIQRLAEEVEELFGVSPSISLSYGLSEVGLVGVSEGSLLRNQLYVVPDSVLVEVVGSDGRPLPLNSVGEIVVTPLRTRGTLLVRYRTGDIGAAHTLSGRLAIKVHGRKRSKQVLYIAGSYLYLQDLLSELKKEVEVPLQLEAVKGKGVRFRLYVPFADERLKKKLKAVCLEKVSELANLSDFDLKAERVRVEVLEGLADGKAWKLRA